jgi:hypothetical protein
MGSYAPPKKLPLQGDDVVGQDVFEPVHPLQLIAHHLHRIDEHLTCIASAIKNGEGSDKLHMQLQSIDQAIRIQSIEKHLSR